MDALGLRQRPDCRAKSPEDTSEPIHASRMPAPEHVYNVPPISTLKVNVREAGESSQHLFTSSRIDVSRPPPKIVSIKYVSSKDLSKNFGSRYFLKSSRPLTQPGHSQSPKLAHNSENISYNVACIVENKPAFSSKEQPRTIETCQHVNPGSGLTVKCSSLYESQPFSNEMPGGGSKIVNGMNRYKPIHCNFVTKNNCVNKINPVIVPVCNVVLSLLRYQMMVSLLFPTIINSWVSLVNNPHCGILFPRSSLCK